MIRTLATILLLTAAAAGAQPPLAGTWEYTAQDEAGSYVARLVLAADGTASLDFRGSLTGGFADGESVPPGVLPDPLLVDFVGSGTWTADGDSLRLDMTARQLRLMDLPFVEAIDSLAATLARALAVELEIPEEEIPAFVDLVRGGLRDELDEDALLADFLGVLGGAIPYELVTDGEGRQALRFADEDGTIETWRRVDPTAVTVRGWGLIKRTIPERSWTD